MELDGRRFKFLILSLLGAAVHTILDALRRQTVTARHRSGDGILLSAVLDCLLELPLGRLVVWTSFHSRGPLLMTNYTARVRVEWPTIFGARIRQRVYGPRDLRQSETL